MKERWVAIPGFEGLYEVSDLGRVRSLDRVVMRRTHLGNVHPKRIRGQMQTLAKHRSGYELIHLWKENQRHVDTVHAVVLAAFVGPRPEGKDGCHNNGVRNDNRLANLRYDTRSGNHADKVAHDTHQRGERSPNARLSNADVHVLRHQREGIPKEDLAAEFGLSADHLRKVRSGARRVHG